MVEQGFHDVGDVAARSRVDGSEATHEAAAVDRSEKFALDVAGVAEPGGVSRLDLDV